MRVENEGGIGWGIERGNEGWRKRWSDSMSRRGGRAERGKIWRLSVF